MNKFKAPEKTSVYKKDPGTDKYSIGFAPELINFIKEKKKIKTFRFGDKKDYLKIDDVVEIYDSVNDETVGKAKIVDKQNTTFGELPLQMDGHETYEDKEQQRKVFSGYYAYLERSIKDSDTFIILTFKLV